MLLVPTNEATVQQGSRGKQIQQEKETEDSRNSGQLVIVPVVQLGISEEGDTGNTSRVLAASPFLW